MKHWKQILAAALSIILLCGVCFAVSGFSAPRANASNEDTVSTQPESSFTNVPAEAWYAEAANWCKAQGILLGDTFSPETAMTRATVAEALYRAEGSPTVSGSTVFSDIENGSVYASAAAWTSANGVMSGYGGGVFGANDPVTREQMAAVLWRYAGSPAAEAGENFADKASIASYAQTAVGQSQWCNRGEGK